jgi:hypothetical protein
MYRASFVILYCNEQLYNYITTVSLCNLHCYMFRPFLFIIRPFTTNALLLYSIILFNLFVQTLLSLVGGPLSGNKRVWFTESHIIFVISFYLLIYLLNLFLLIEHRFAKSS